METIVKSNGQKSGLAPSDKRARKVRRKRLTWGAIALLVVGLLVYFLFIRSKQSQVSLKDLQTAQAFRTTLIETVTAAGSVTAQTGARVNIGAQVTGRIKKLDADVGTKVQAGQVIAELDLPDTQAQLGTAQAALTAAESKLAQERGGVGMEFEQTTAAVQTAKDALSAAQAKLQSAIAASAQQPHQTASDIARAKAVLNTSAAQLNQAQKSHDLSIATAKAAITQAEASAKNAATTLGRQKQLFKQGYIAATDVDTAQTASDVAAAQLDTAKQNYSLAVAKADADLQTAEQQVAQSRAGVSSANAEQFLDVQRHQDVVNAQAAVRQAQAQLNSAQAGMTSNALKQQDIAQAQDAVTQAQQQVKYWQAQVAKSVIRTPISGTVLSLAMQQGETLVAGLSAPTLVVVADLDRLQVDAFVDETDIGKVKLGQSATITVDAYPDQTFSGKVTKIDAGSTLQNSVVTYDVSIAIKDPKHQLRPDMTTSVNIGVGEFPDVVAVPNEAIKPGKSGSTVWLVAKGATTPEMQPVQTGATDGTYTEIKSGLSDGDTVVLAGWPPSAGFGGRSPMTPFGGHGGHK